MNNSKRKLTLERAAVWVIAVLFVIWSAAFIYRTSFVGIDGRRYFSLFDDAMISMRYGWNLSHGLGLVWNSGEYVEGYTNLLMTLVMSAATLFFDKARAVLSIQVLGVSLMLGSAYLTMRIAGIITPMEDRRRSLLGILCFLGVLLYYPLVFWSLMGMETGLLTLLLLLAVFFALKYINQPTSLNLMLTAVWLGLAFMTRSDSAIFAFLIFVFIAVQSYRPGWSRVEVGRMLGALVLYGLFVAGLLLFQRVYYGEMLPNTYVLKLTGLPLSFRIRDGIGFVSPFLAESALVFVVVALSLILDFKRVKLFLASFVVAAAVYQVWVGGDPWPYWRIMSPAMPIVLLLFIQAVIFFAGRLFDARAIREFFLHRQKVSQPLIFSSLVIILTVGGLAVTDRNFLGEMFFRSRAYTVENNAKNVNSALAINQMTKEDATVGVFWGGTVPYYADRKAVDFLGKADRYIAHLPPDTSGVVAWSGMISVPGHNKYDLNYSIKTLQPTYVQGYIWGLQNLSEWAVTKYVTVEYCGVPLLLLKDSDSVYWDRAGGCP